MKKIFFQTFIIGISVAVVMVLVDNALGVYSPEAGDVAKVSHKIIYLALGWISVELTRMVWCRDLV